MRKTAIDVIKTVQEVEEGLSIYLNQLQSLLLRVVNGPGEAKLTLV